MTASKKDPLVKRVLGVDTQERYKRYPKDLEQRAKETVLPARIYSEEEPTVVEWFKEMKPTKQGASHYVRSLFPSAGWIPRYNWRWLVGDSIAGMVPWMDYAYMTRPVCWVMVC